MTNLDPDTAKRTLRRLHGEPAGADRDDAGRDDDDGRIEQLWRALDPPPASEPPPHFASRTADVLRRRRDAAAWSAAPAWARGSAAAALAAGLLLGVGVGRWSTDEPETVPGDSPSQSAISATSISDFEELGPEPTDWTEESWGEAWNRAFDTSFGPEGNGS